MKSNVNILRDRRFWPLFWTQFCGACNDNVLKNAIGILVVYKSFSLGGIAPKQMVPLIAGIFILPFFLFSGISGQLADKYPKPRIIRLVKTLEILIMCIAMTGFFQENLILLLTALFMMGIHSALFGPVKYSILPHILTPEELIKGNAYIESGTFVAILLGSILGTELIIYAYPGTLPVALEHLISGSTWLNNLFASLDGHGPEIIGCLLMIIAVIGFSTSLAVRPLAPVSPNLKIRFNPWVTTKETLSIAREVRSVFLSLIALSWFWFMGVTLLSVFPPYCEEFLKADESVVTLFLTLFSIGIGFGSILCEKLSFKRIELGLVPIGSIGITIFALDLFLAGQPLPEHSGLMGASAFLHTPGGIRVSVDLFMFSVFSGFFTVPLYAFIQQRSRSAIRSRVIAANNIINSLFMVVASITLMGLYALNLTYTQIFLFLAILNMVAAIWIYAVIPEFLLRVITWVFVNIVYRLKVIGRENLPAEEPFVIVCNHVTPVDGLIIASACPRPLRFVMYYKYFNKPVVRRLFKDAKAIPIAGVNEDRKVLEAAMDRISYELSDRESVCIFPEGSLTKDGQMQPFRPGIEAILQLNPVPVIPACLNGMWGSYFSRKDESGKRPFRRVWSRISVEFGPPVPAEEATAEKLYALVKAMRKDGL